MTKNIKRRKLTNMLILEIMVLHHSGLLEMLINKCHNLDLLLVLILLLMLILDINNVLFQPKLLGSPHTLEHLRMLILEIMVLHHSGLLQMLFSTNPLQLDPLPLDYLSRVQFRNSS
jgi:hypothetical protein